MTAYLIVFGKDHTDRLAAYSFPDRASARVASLSALVPRVPPDGPAGGHAYLVETEEDIIRSPLFGQLVTFYNELSPAPINRFESRTIGVRRLLALLAAQARPPNGVASTEGENMPNETPRTRTRRPITLKEQKIAYNELVIQAQGLGLNIKTHKSKTFNNYESGEKRIAALQAKIAAAASPAAE